MQFNDIFREIRKECGWENYPSELIDPAVKVLQISDIEMMLNALQYFTKEVMREDAGDIGDERQRLSLAIWNILKRTTLPVEEEMLRLMPDLLPFTQKLILDLMVERNYLRAYAAVTALMAQTKKKSVREKCAATLRRLGF